MRLTKTIFALVFFITTETVWGQESSTVTGYVLFSPWRTHQSFDLFFSAEIDSTKDLKHNLQHARLDTAGQFSQAALFWDLLKIATPDTIKNEALDASIADYLEYCIVFPVVLTIDRKATELLYKHVSNELTSWPVTFYGKELFTLYNSRPRIYTNIRVIKLPKQSG
ncbi:hypothetical protein [Lacibacter sp. H407]|uniref:hypothetical protein n=1 Tax=Lacibacter sp. H407 TaxID=3133423 RepID=UPI0030BB4D6A